MKTTRSVSLLPFYYLGVLSIFLSAPASSLAADDPPGAYADFVLPSKQESADLQSFALKHHVDYEKVLSELSDGDPRTLAKYFSLSLKFDSFDRRAQIYGYYLFVFSMYCMFEDHDDGQGRYARLLDAQPPQVRQRVRDFIYYDAVQAPAAGRAELEKIFRKAMPAMFPPTYTFGEKDPLFAPFCHKP